jgi:hypothetical protein
LHWITLGVIEVTVGLYFAKEGFAIQPPGIPGPQAGNGILAVADWWLGSAGAVLDVEAAATPPATTTARAKVRMTNFILVTSCGFRLAEEISSDG